MALWKPNDATSFTPQQYFEFFDAASITQSGGLVTQVNDKTSNARHATASGGGRPNYGATVFNGAPGVEAYGGSARLTVSTTKPVTDNLNGVGDTASFTVTIAGSTDYPNPDAYGLDWSSPGGFVVYGDTSAWYVRINGTEVATGGWTDPPAEPFIVWGTVQLYSGGPFGFGRWASTEGAPANTLTLLNKQSADRGFDGAMGTLGGGTAASIPSLADVERTEGYQLWATGLQALLPPGHPFAGAAPTTASPFTGTLAATEAKDAAAIAGALGITGTLAATNAKDSAAITGAIGVSGTLAATEAKDSAAISGALGVSGSLAATEAKDAAALTGTVVIPGVAGTLAATEAKDVAAFAGSLGAFGTLAATEAKDTAIIVGSILTPLTGTLAATEAKDVATFVATLSGWGPLSPPSTFWTPQAPDTPIWSPL